MFSDNAPTTQLVPEGLTFEQREDRHLINRLRLEFRTASQRQLEDAVLLAHKDTPTYASEKILQLARTHLADLLTPAAALAAADAFDTEPAFRAQVA